MLGDSTPAAIVVVIASLIISLSLHEMMHAFTGHWLGDDTAKMSGRLTLNPLKHIDPVTTVLLPIVTYVLFKVPLIAARPVPFNPSRVRHEEYGAALIGLAGPFTNLALALVGGLAAHLSLNHVAYGLTQALVIFTEVNVAVFIFNMIPIPPLDGSRALYAVAPEPVQDFMATLEPYGIFLIFGLILIVPAFTSLLANLNDAVLRVLLG